MDKCISDMFDRNKAALDYFYNYMNLVESAFYDLISACEFKEKWATSSGFEILHEQIGLKQLISNDNVEFMKLCCSFYNRNHKRCVKNAYELAIYNHNLKNKDIFNCELDEYQLLSIIVDFLVSSRLYMNVAPIEIYKYSQRHTDFICSEHEFIIRHLNNVEHYHSNKYHSQ